MMTIKKLSSVILSIVFIIAFSLTGYAHGGRTDSSGGHKDNNNVSGLGSYHYHCDGYSAHLHANGVCPHDKNVSTPLPTPATKPVPAPASMQTISSIKTEGSLVVHFIDVGQGDAILIQLPNKEVVLIDAGGGNGSKVVKYIHDLKIEKINYLIATHPHEDHIGGMAAVIKGFDIGKIYMPDVTHTTKAFENMLLAIDTKGLKINIAKESTVLIEKNDIFGIFIAPNGDKYTNLNNYSAVLYLEYGDVSFLLMGDAEALSEDEIVENWTGFQADVIKIGHHGSGTSSSSKFMDIVSPSYAVISVGINNTYGHPTNSTLNKLMELKAEVFRTDLNGTVMISTDGKKIFTYSEK